MAAIVGRPPPPGLGAALEDAQNSGGAAEAATNIRSEREPVAEPAVGVQGRLHRHQPLVVGRVERLAVRCWRSAPLRKFRYADPLT